jgi:hypothetical protein
VFDPFGQPFVAKFEDPVCSKEADPIFGVVLQECLRDSVREDLEGLLLEVRQVDLDLLEIYGV